MKTGIILVILTALLSLLSCSGDVADKEPPKQSAPASVETQPTVPYPNSPTAQDLQPDLHVSGTQSTHVSGAIETSEHISGQ
jgi:hypothetical protein